MAAALPPLALEHGDRVLLDLMDLGVDAPVGRIGIPPLRADGDGRGRNGALFQPAAEKGFAEAVGTGRIEVADPAAHAASSTRCAFASRLGASLAAPRSW